MSLGIINSLAVAGGKMPTLDTPKKAQPLAPPFGPVAATLPTNTPSPQSAGSDATRRARALLAFKNNLRAQAGPTTVDTRRPLGKVTQVGASGQDPAAWDRNATVAFDQLHPDAQNAWAAFAHGEGPHPDAGNMVGGGGGVSQPFGKLGSAHASPGPVQPSQTLSMPQGDAHVLAQVNADKTAGIASRGDAGNVTYENGARIATDGAGGKTLSSPYGTGYVTQRGASGPPTPARFNMSNTYDKNFFGGGGQSASPMGTPPPAPATSPLAKTLPSPAASGQPLSASEMADYRAGITTPLPAPSTPNPVRTTPLPPIDKPADTAQQSDGGRLKRPLLGTG